MNSLKTENSNVENISCRLEKSVQQYRDLLEKAKNILETVCTGDHTKMTKDADELDRLQNQAKINDDQLLPVVMKSPEKFMENGLFQKRNKLIMEIISINNQLTPKLNAMKAVAASEREKLLTSRKAFDGYRTSNSHLASGSFGVG